VSSTCFEHPSVHPQEDLYMQFYGISFMHPYKESGWWQDVLKVSSTSCLRSDCLYGCMKYPNIARISLPEDEHLDVRNMLKTLQLNYRGADKSLDRPGRKQDNVSVRMAWICFGALPCRGGGNWWQLVSRYCLNQCFSTAGTWHQLYRAVRGSPGICHFSFLSSFHE